MIKKILSVLHKEPFCFENKYWIQKIKNGYLVHHEPPNMNMTEEPIYFREKDEAISYLTYKMKELV